MEKVNYGQVLKGIKAGKMPETSGIFIRALLVEGKSTADEIVVKTHKAFKDSACKRADVYWNRAKLKQEKVKVPDTPKPEKAEKPTAKKATKTPAKKKQ